MFFRIIKPEECEQAIRIEQICFPPNEACSPKSMMERIFTAPELFLIAMDEKSGLIAGFLNGIATDEQTFRDDFFTDIRLHNPSGRNIMLLGLDVLPEYRGKGLAKELVRRFAGRERARERLVLTCLEEKVTMYEHMGFSDKGIANSTWGGEEWHEMVMYLSSFLQNEFFLNKFRHSMIV